MAAICIYSWNQVWECVDESDSHFKVHPQPRIKPHSLRYNLQKEVSGSLGCELRQRRQCRARGQAKLVNSAKRVDCVKSAAVVTVSVDGEGGDDQSRGGRHRQTDRQTDGRTPLYISATLPAHPAKWVVRKRKSVY